MRSGGSAPPFSSSSMSALFRFPAALIASLPRPAEIYGGRNSGEWDAAFHVLRRTGLRTFETGWTPPMWGRPWRSLGPTSNDLGSGGWRSEGQQLNFALPQRKALLLERRGRSQAGRRNKPASPRRNGWNIFSGDRGIPSEEGFEEAVGKSLQGLWQGSWAGFTRNMSQITRRNREDDPGDWRLSPEWFGTQAGGWGHNEGETVFETISAKGNGVVSVTAHPSSTPKTPKLQSADKDAGDDPNTDRVIGYEWRVLRFNNVTRQSVAKIRAVATTSGNVVLLQEPHCVAFEYLKSMIAAGLTAVSLSGLDLQLVRNGLQKMRILCIGMGGGSLPLFLAHRLPGATVDVVEIDAAVITAAVDSMGFPPPSVDISSSETSVSNGQGLAADDQSKLWGDILKQIIVHEKDGDDFVQLQARKALEKEVVTPYDLVFVDAYDGEDLVPSKLWDRNFLSSLGSLLAVDHGTVVVNLHTDSAPPNIFERISGKFGPGFDPALPQGRRVLDAACAYRDNLLQNGNKYDGGTNLGGLTFTVAVPFQGNVSLVVTRGTSLQLGECTAVSDSKSSGEDALIQTFVTEAAKVQTNLSISFDFRKRISRGFQIVKGTSLV